VTGVAAAAGIWVSEHIRQRWSLLVAASRGTAHGDAMEILGIVITALIMLALFAGDGGGEVCDQCNGRWMNLYGGGPAQCAIAVSSVDSDRSGLSYLIN
jgi:hypothetical protein